MAGSDEEKKVEIPEWQRASINDTVTPATGAQEDQRPEADKYTIEAARKWLDDDTIRKEPRDRKITFLRGKGLQDEAIQSLLGPENPETAASSDADLKTVHDSTTTVVQTDERKPQTAATTTRISTHESRRDGPPIITYPEFLTRPQKPPPLVTAQRLIYAAYAFAGISTLTYGASKFLVQPMLESLTSAREELASTALQDLEKLNAKLEGTVSHVPYVNKLDKNPDGEYHDDDGESIDSDPTELFHRDIGIQTSPPRSRSSSTSSTDRRSKDPAARHAASLSSLLENLKTLKPPDDEDDDDLSVIAPATSLKETVSGFQKYLNTLQFSGSSYRTDYNSIYTSMAASDNKKASKNPNETDEAAKLKAEIRALKGVFLSSRNFPGRPAVTGLKG